MKLKDYEQKIKELQYIIDNSDGVKRIFARQDKMKLEKTMYELNTLR